MGRPSDYGPEIAGEICDRLASGQTLREICRDEAMPVHKTIYRWMREHQEFSAQYAHAREVQADTWADEILEISDDGSNDWMARQHGDNDPVEVPNHEHISRSKLRVDARKWLMGKAAPKKYGDRVAHEVSGPGGKPIEMTSARHALAGKLARLTGAGSASSDTGESD